MKKIAFLILVTMCATMVVDAFTGQGTYYDPSIGYSACGTRHGTNELVAALNAPQFDPRTPNGNPNRNSLCNRSVQIRGPKGSVNVRIVDRCPSCRYGDLDLSPKAFRRINGGSLAAGRVKIDWSWI